MDKNSLYQTRINEYTTAMISARQDIDILKRKISVINLRYPMITTDSIRDELLQYEKEIEELKELKVECTREVIKYTEMLVAFVAEK